MGTYLVTGGSGFLGGALVRRLCAEGHAVRSLDIFDSPDRPEEARFVKCDVRDLEGVEKACEGADTIFHNAALVPLTKAGGAFREVNVIGTENVLKAALSDRIRKIVHASSSAIYGVPDKCPITEDAPPSPIEAYGRSKLEGEEILKSHFGKGGPTISIIRPRTIVGTGRLGIFQILFSWISAGKNIYTIGRGGNMLQFLHISDLVDSMLLAADRNENETYNIGASGFSTLHEDLSSLCEHAGTGAKVKHLPVWPSIAALRTLDILRICPLAPWHYLTYHKPFYFDVSKARNMLGWEPRYGNVEMFSEAYDYFIANRREENSAENRSAHRKSPAEKILRLLKWFS